MDNKTRTAHIDFLGIFNARNIVFVAMLAVGTLCILMSARNTASYLLLTGMDRSMAILTGIALIIFSSTSLTAAQLFLSQKGLVKLVSIPFVVVGLTVITFSIFSTLSLNYNKFISSEIIQQDMQAKIEQKRSELMAAQNSGTVDITQETFANIDRILADDSLPAWAKGELLARINTAVQNSTKVEEGKRQIIENVYVETLPRTFFGFLLDIKKLETKYSFDFFMIAIPAVFYDLIAPIAMMVVLFLMGFGKNGARVSVKETEPAKKAEPESKKSEASPPVEELIAYINNALQDDLSLCPDDAVRGIEKERCAEYRKFLMTFIYKDKPVIDERNGRWVAIFARDNFNRFIKLQCNVRRSSEGETK